MPAPTQAKVIDNFDNDSSVADQYGIADAAWWTPFAAVYSYEINTARFKSSPASLKVTFDKTKSSDLNAYLGAGDLSFPGNVKDYSKYTTISFWIYWETGNGPFSLNLRFSDSSGRQSELLGSVQASMTGEWRLFTWDLTTLKWNSCDKTAVRDIFFYANYGYTGWETIYIDDIEAYPDPLPPSTKNILLNDFNRGQNPNYLGGDSAIWTDDRYCRAEYYNKTQEDVFGNNGYSLKIEIGKDSIPYFKTGYWTGLQGLNISTHSAVTMVVKGSLRYNFEVGLKDKSGFEKTVTGNYFFISGTSPVLDNNYRRVSIPLYNFTGIDLIDLDNLSIQFQAGESGTIYVDDIVFAKSAASLKISDFESGSAVLNYSGSAGNLGSGSITISSETANGAACGKITGSGAASIVDNFDDLSDPNEWNGSSINGKWTNDNNVITMSYAAGQGRSSTGALSCLYDVSKSTLNSGFWITLFSTTPANISGYDYLSFYIRASTPGLQLMVGIQDDGGREPKVFLSSFSTAGGVTSAWTQVKIPLSAYLSVNNAFNKSGVRLVSFAFNEQISTTALSGELFIDDLGFGYFSIWDGVWYSFSPSINSSKHGKITFSARGAKGDEKISLMLQGGGDSSKYGQNLTNAWNDYTVQFSTFTGANPAAISTLHFALTSSTHIVYIDDIYLGRDAIPPVAPSGLKANGETVGDGSELTPYTLLSVTADSFAEDSSAVGVRFQYSDGISWKTISTDYNIDDRTYTAGWNISDLIGTPGISLRALALDWSGNETPIIQSAVDLNFVNSEVMVYPNPYYLKRGAGLLYFNNIVSGGMLKIYSLSGDLVCILYDDGLTVDKIRNDGQINWNGKNSTGSGISSGIYLYVVEKGGKRISSGKFAVYSGYHE